MAEQQSLIGSDALRKTLEELRDDQLAVAIAALMRIEAKYDGLLALIRNLGDASALSLDAENGYMVCGQPLMTVADGAPTAAPLAKGCFWYDQTNKALYVSKAVTGSVSDWGVVE